MAMGLMRTTRVRSSQVSWVMRRTERLAMFATPSKTFMRHVPLLSDWPWLAARHRIAVIFSFTWNWSLF